MTTEINIRDEIIGRGNGLSFGPVEVAAENWPEACRQIIEGEWLDADDAECPADDGAGWYPVVYRCANGEWRGRMEIGRAGE